MYDTRDLRDPQKLGEWLLNRPSHKKASVGYDKHIHAADIPDYSHNESLGAVAAREYRAELEARDDIYAKSALESLDAGKGVVGFDDAG